MPSDFTEDRAPRRLLVDLTRSVQRLRHTTPSGIDRVELAYLDWAIGHPGTHYLVGIGRRQHLLGPGGGLQLRATLAGGSVTPLDLRGHLSPYRPEAIRRAEAQVRRLATGDSGPGGTAALLRRAGFGGPGAVYLNVGHDNLDPDHIAAIAGAGIAPVVLLHDLIPLDYPEFARPDGARRFAPKLQAAARAHRLIYNSADTAARAAVQARSAGLTLPPGAVLPLGIALPPGAPATPGAPHFIALGTIEPRKNHLMLLHLWRRMWDAGLRTPQLHIVGRLGWENEMVLDQLERAPMMGQTVFLHTALPDAQVVALLTAARALLLPSLAEGYGLPLAEALALGVPVLAADLAALREVGGAVPEWLDPLDGPGWARAILAYADDPSPARAAQLARLRAWNAPRWQDHFAALERLLDGAVPWAC